MTEVSVDRLMDDVRKMIGEVEDLLKATAGSAGEKVDEARSRAEHTLRSARTKLESLQDDAVSQARHAAGQADRYVRDNPWQSIGIAAGIAFLVGVLVSRR